ncbi:MAG: hypothetical protein COU08_01195 [Candidatus Harrisonbacteria bacterium CG10_big_fil_rev_8_21_14_0_10_42_17]|uniref:YtkA-like domain-containing protein n=1 Tax=Candidatus Harrisonbacteria bacterium CG10_big_fil_rev_8_21_14_0_10_42_17 TaxID=1974584 RepID=A0A2M6WIN3_9BACT|nr:MAG: hypothetical protein COU08_01195 [Candidatus Harrisonbacteria bacterium CG10_big_fil_rev_8_21_14_0_10_42_17]
MANHFVAKIAATNTKRKKLKERKRKKREFVNIARNMKSLFTVGIITLFYMTLMPALPALAHGPEENIPEEFEILIEPKQLVINKDLSEAPIEVSVRYENKALTGIENVLIAVETVEGIRKEFQATERTEGSYAIKYPFTKVGTYEIHVAFTAKGGEIRTTDFLEVIENKTKNVIPYFAGGTLLLIILTWVIKTRGKKKNIKSAITLSIIIIIAAWLGYSLYIVIQNNTNSVVVCPSESICYVTAHIHAYTPIKICGKDIRLPTEVGPLSGPHTHEEKNTIHWHDRLRYDKEKKMLLETEPLMLGAFFEALEMPFDKDILGDTKNGDTCPDGSVGFWKMFVNGKNNDEFRNYIWNDRDVIYFVFDGESIMSIEEELKQNPITFPLLGRG